MFNIVTINVPKDIFRKIETSKTIKLIPYNNTEEALKQTHKKIHAIIAGPHKINEKSLKNLAQTADAPIIVISNAFSQKTKLKRLTKYIIPKQNLSKDMLITFITTCCELNEQIKELKRQLIRAGQHEAPSRLAAGMAHDINGFLMGIGGMLQLIKEDIESDNIPSKNKLIECIHEILDATTKASMLSKRMTKYDHSSLKMQNTDINKVIEEAYTLLASGIGNSHSINIKNQLNSTELIKIDPLELHEIINNLVLNACDAMPNGGTVTISTKDVQLNKKINASNGLIPPGKYICLSVKDEGKGIPQNMKSKIFEPFFSTKGRSSGLGLAIVKDLAEKYSAFINFESSKTGTTFHIYFPIAKEYKQTTQIPSSSKTHEPPQRFAAKPVTTL